MPLIDDVVADLASKVGPLTPRALGLRENARALDLAPFGRSIEFVDAASRPDLVRAYHAANRLAFPGPLSLPGWVLVDLYLAPAAILLLACPASFLSEDKRAALSLSADDEAIAAAYVAVPCAERGTVMGVSLFSHLASRGAGTLAKALALGMLRAERQRGIAQLGSRSLRVHTRMGVLRVLGPAPVAHEEASTSFVYEVDLSDSRAWAEALAGEATRDGTAVRLADRAEIAAVLDRARAGERVEIVPPGLSDDGEAVYLRIGQ